MRLFPHVRLAVHFSCFVVALLVLAPGGKPRSGRPKTWSTPYHKHARHVRSHIEHLRCTTVIRVSPKQVRALLFRLAVVPCLVAGWCVLCWVQGSMAVRCPLLFFAGPIFVFACCVDSLRRLQREIFCNELISLVNPGPDRLGIFSRVEQH